VSARARRSLVDRLGALLHRTRRTPHHTRLNAAASETAAATPATVQLKSGRFAGLTIGAPHHLQAAEILAADPSLSGDDRQALETWAIHHRWLAGPAPGGLKARFDSGRFATQTSAAGASAAGASATGPHDAELEYAFRVLDLSPRAALGDVRQRYRALMKALHPDHGGSETLSRLVNAAYQTITRTYQLQA